jgi:hypothetical protein
MINELTSWRRRRWYHERPTQTVDDGTATGDPANAVVRRVVVGRALDRLTPRQRAVLVLRFYEVLSEGETDHSESWRLREVLPEGLLLVHSEVQRVLSLELYRPTTGELFLVTDLTKLPSGKT